MISAATLVSIMPSAGAAAFIYAPLLAAAMEEYEINTCARQRCFLAQIAHESMQLQCTREIWGPTAAQRRYEMRRDLGNRLPGDGQRFLGRGLLQITGRANYALCSDTLYGDRRLLETPELLEEPEGASRSAGWFWYLHGLNELADIEDFSRITQRINGGLRSLAERTEFLERAVQVIV
jgi:putative chitinase